MLSRSDMPTWIKRIWWFYLRVLKKFRKFIEFFYLNYRSAAEADYIRMQRKYYLRNAKKSRVEPGLLIDDHVVGSWQEHDLWPDYEAYLMKYVDSKSNLVALDFGCGPGRNIRRWTDWFQRIDGADISANNLSNAKIFLKDQIHKSKEPNLFLTNGTNCGDASSDAYDFVFSTVCLQHICSHSVRFSILNDIYRILKPGGRLSLQMGYGSPSPMTVGYFENNFAAEATNRSCDTEVASPEEPRQDLEKIGFVNYEFWIRPVGPGDVHPNWIFFTATKPQ
jgi:SAM-dependent methyltransferase